MKFDLQRLENVCFEGGGIKGNAFIGVYRALEEKGLVPKRYIGASAGAIFAGAAACKITYANMKSVVDATDYTKFKDASFSVFGEGFNMLKHMGVYKGNYFYHWCGNIYAKYAGNADITFNQVFQKYGTELVIVTTDVTIGKAVYLNRVDNPDMPIRLAIRMSMSIPVFYVPIITREANGLNHVYVDGGCTNNFPLTYFDALYATPNDLASRTLGFNLTDYTGDPTVEPNITYVTGNVIDLVTNLIDINMVEQKALQLHETDRYRIVDIPTFGFSSTNFELSKSDILKLEDSGYQATIEFCKQNTQ